MKGKQYLYAVASTFVFNQDYCGLLLSSATQSKIFHQIQL